MDEAGMGDESAGRLPDCIRLLRDFVNTYEPQIDEETFSSTTAMRKWFVTRTVMSRNATLTDADLAAVVAVREGLRSLLLMNAGHTANQDALDALDAVLTELPVRVDFDRSPTGGGYRLVSTQADGRGRVLGALLDAVREAREAGTWPRLKVCARDTCRWAFYDESKNKVRRWCSMAGCGNYVKMRRARSKPT